MQGLGPALLTAPPKKILLRKGAELSSGSTLGHVTQSGATMWGGGIGGALVGIDRALGGGVFAGQP